MYKKVLKSISHRKVQIKMTMRYYYTLIRMATIEDISSVQSLSHVRLFATPWPADHQASLSITNSQSLFKPMSIELVMLSKHLILCRPLHLLPSIFPSIRLFSNAGDIRDVGLISLVRKLSQRRAWQPTPVFLPGESLWTEESGGLQSIGL